MELKCLKCGCEGAYKYGHMKGYRDTGARIVGINSQKTTPRGKPEKDKILALVLYFIRLINERYRKDSRRDNSECDALDQKDVR